MTTSIALLLGSLQVSALYALIASGLSLVWGTVQIFNFAAGAMLMAGAYVAWTVNGTTAGAVTFVGILASVAALSVGSMLLYRLTIRPYLNRRDGTLITFVTTLAAATVLESSSQLIFGPDFRKLGPIATGQISILGTGVSWQEIIIILLGPALLVALATFLKHARLGMAIRAVAQNRPAAMLMGINVDTTYMVAFIGSAVLATIAGVLYGGEFYVSPTMGQQLLVDAFIVVIIGGLGSLGGTVAGAYLVGTVDTVSQYFVGPFWSPVILFAVLFCVLLARPTGLLGKAV